MRKTKGFTLVELLVVIIIVGILAAVAVPIIRGNTIRAMFTEATAALGTIRSAQRGYFVENNSYQGLGRISGTSKLAGMFVRTGPSYQNPGPGGLGDLDGTYFSQDCYVVVSGYAYCILGYQVNRAPKAAYVASLLGITSGWIRINFTTGELEHYNIPDSGYPSYN